MPTPIQMPSWDICATSLASSVFLRGQVAPPPQAFSAMASLLVLKAWPAGLLPLFLASFFSSGSPSPLSLGSCLDTRNSLRLHPGLSWALHQLLGLPASAAQPSSLRTICAC